MSLLLDALRRAEEDSRKRKLDASATGAGPTPMAPVGGTPADQAQASGAELTLQAQTPPSIPTQEPTGDGVQAPASETGFPDLTLVSDQAAAPAPLPQAAPVTAVAADPRTPIQSYGRYARPTGAEAGQSTGPVAGGWAAAQVAREPVRPSTGSFAGPAPVSQAPEATPTAAGPLDRAAPLAGTTQRQAISAASAMAGAGARKVPNRAQRRQWLLAAVALVVALPLAAFLLFGDALFGSSSTLLASKPIVPVVAPQVAAPEASPAPPTDTAAPGNLPAAASETTAVAGADRGAPDAAQPVAGMVPSPAPGVAGGPTRTSSGPVPVTSRPRMVAQNSARTTAARQAPTSGDSRGGADVAAGGPGVALRPNAAKPASLMDAAYAAYQAGKTTEATRLYQEVLRADPTQRDAWLGLAVIAHASNQREPAMDAYKRVLRLEPQNATALAGLSSLITNAGEPQQESRLREMLARSPQEADLNNALGLVLSGEKRWSEAQPLFFKAHSAAPQEPQFAYNLAVTLDHLRKSGLAAQYYETAIKLAQGRASGFDETSARTRLAALKAGAAAGASR
ncbi:MAG: tetratricopeptide repeat protein [Polaromonas sp.]|uniref:tetratricopeptide repeat protein n=1 Tax=Polaromonas sp. TaxID=1869339 RepID=UPI002723C52A|nr:tetratricopeptide repeat protein [Polaromonas sp.]MDO9113399.1 tetratricopeptide repeat protein [Polaromonas sp.]MDP1887493.1 tetratricopeptide repeat protein [Polaromonas sp.]